MSLSAAKRYATGLFDFAEESNQTEVLFKEFTELLKSLPENRELQNFLSNPLLESKRKEPIALEIFKNFSQTFQRYIILLIRQKREKILMDSGRYFHKLVNQKNKIKEVTIFTVNEVGEKEQNEILSKLKSLQKEDYSYKVTTELRPELIGGFVVKMDDLLVDASVKNKLRNLKREFSYNDYEVKF